MILPIGVQRCICQICQVWGGGYVFLDDLLPQIWLQGMWSWILKPDLWWNLSGRPAGKQTVGMWKMWKTRDEKTKVKNRFELKFIGNISTIWYEFWKNMVAGSWNRCIFFFGPTVWSPPNTSGSNHIARFPLPGYAHTGLLGDRCRPIAGCCHCRVCFNISSIVLRHNIGFPTIVVSFNLAAMIFLLSSNLF